MSSRRDGRGIVLGRKANAHRRAGAWGRLDGDAAAVLLHHLVDQAESETRARSHVLRGEEGIEDAALDVLGNSRTVVRDLDLERVGLADRAERDLPALAQRVECVVREVDDDLLELRAVARDGRRPTRRARARASCSASGRARRGVAPSRARAARSRPLRAVASRCGRTRGAPGRAPCSGALRARSTRSAPRARSPCRSAARCPARSRG